MPKESPVDHPLTYDLTVSEILQRWPQTAVVFLRHRMACVGCAIAPFETLSEVTDIYQVNLDEFLQELEDASLSASNDP
jgi:hybrid cluster-associated redox disulfide protein